MDFNDITCDYIDCDSYNASSWNWVTASNGLDDVNFCSQEHHDIWMVKNAGNFWPNYNFMHGDLSEPQKQNKIDKPGEYRCKLSPYITDENKDSVIQTVMQQFQTFGMNPNIVAPQGEKYFMVTLEKGAMEPHEVKQHLNANYFIDQVSTPTDAKVKRNYRMNIPSRVQSSTHTAVPYHVSPDYNRESIEQNGLDPFVNPHNWHGEGWENEQGWSIPIKPGVYMSPTPDDANDWADQIQNTWQSDMEHNDPYYQEHKRKYPHDFDLYHVDTEGLPVEENITDIGKPEIISRLPITPNRITHIKRFDPWKQSSTNDITSHVMSLTKANDRSLANYEKVEWIPLEDAHKIREFDRLTPEHDTGKSRSTVDGIKKLLLEEGFRSPLNVDYNINDRYAYLGEGNHRLIAAQELGLTHVPVTVHRSGEYSKHGNKGRGNAKQVNGVDPDQFGYVPGQMTPTQIGLTHPSNVRIASVNGQGYDAPVDSNLHAETDQDPQYIINQADITDPQRTASKSYEDENTHHAIANYFKQKYNWDENDRFGKEYSDYSSSDTKKNLSLLHGFTSDAWGDECTCPLCSFARNVEPGKCSSCNSTYDQSNGDRLFLIRPGTNILKKNVWSYNPDANVYTCPSCITKQKTGSKNISWYDE